MNYLKEAQAGQPTEEETRAQEESYREALKEEAEAHKCLIKLEKEKAAMDEELLGLEEVLAGVRRGRRGAFWREHQCFREQAR